MKKSVITLSSILTLLAFTVSCSHQSAQETNQREIASTDCKEKSRPDYHSYFDSAEKCIEKQ
jgi:hypothetical protein